MSFSNPPETSAVHIDAHQHFWRYDPSEYDWIGDNMRVIRRDFLPDDLLPVLFAADVQRTVAVQARQSLVETEWLLNLARTHAWISGVVGWVPLRDGERVADCLDRLSDGSSKLVGVRHVLQAESDEFFADASFNEGLKSVTRARLTYDLLVIARQLPAAIALVDRHPEQAFVVDHLAKPEVGRQVPASWRRDLEALARRERVCCKLSGLVTEAPGFRWDADLLRPYIEFALEVFGSKRLMFGSDWPVCLVASEYVRWRNFVEDCLRGLSADEREGILGGNASRFYGIA
jgi:L-fuconolactonase